MSQGPTGPDAPHGDGDPGGLPDRVRMPLLALITQQSLDEDYRVTAARRAESAESAGGGADGADRPRRPTLVVVAAVVAVFGLLVGTAAAQTSREAGNRASSRGALVASIESERTRVAAQQERAADLRDSVERLQDRLTTTSDAAQRSETRVRRLTTVAGFSEVTGPGLRVVVTQSPTAADDPDSAVKDSDLALLVNGLWQSGAEAVAVNGRRLTTTSSITTSGTAIEVDGAGITAPYVVLAIGDRRTLAADLVDTTTGLAFAGLAATYGFGYELEPADDLALPAAPAALRRLRSVR